MEIGLYPADKGQLEHIISIEGAKGKGSSFSSFKAYEIGILISGYAR